MKDIKREIVWKDKYRPKTLDTFVCDDEMRSYFQKCIDNHYLSDSILLAGAPGTGKSTLAKILVSNIPCDSMYINVSKERGIDTLRDRVDTFARWKGKHDQKIIILDESDGMTIDFSKGLRSLMEETSLYTKFILTANYLSKIIDPIQSRCEIFVFKDHDIDFIVKYLSDILTTEEITFTESTVREIARKTYPDLRKAISQIQRGSISGELKVPKSVTSDTSEKIFKLYKKNQIKDIRKILINEPVVYEDLYRYFFDNTEDPKELIALKNGLKDHFFASDKEINFIGTILEMKE